MNNTSRKNRRQADITFTLNAEHLKRLMNILTLTEVCLLLPTAVCRANMPKPWQHSVVERLSRFLPAGRKGLKYFDTYKSILSEVLVTGGFTRTDCVVAVGGGVTGDMAGFAAASFMRGIDFYNIPTTVLSQVDSSVGGKTAIDFDGYKNIIRRVSSAEGRNNRPRNAENPA